RRHTRFSRDWSSDVCSSDLIQARRRSRYSLLRRTCALLAKPVRSRQHGRTFGPSTASSCEETPCSLPTNTPRLVWHGPGRVTYRSEERRVGKEGRPRGGQEA